MTKRQFWDLAYLRACSLPTSGLLVFGLGFQDDEREALFVEQEEVDEAFGRFLEVLSEVIESLFCERDAGFELDVRGTFRIREEAPACVLKQLVDFDAGGGFLFS